MGSFEYRHSTRVVRLFTICLEMVGRSYGSGSRSRGDVRSNRTRLCEQLGFLLSFRLTFRLSDFANSEGRAAFSKSLAELTAGMPAGEKRRVVAIFLAIYSAPFWELLRKRGGLSEADAIAAAEWALSALMQSLRQKGTFKNNARRKQ